MEHTDFTQAVAACLRGRRSSSSSSSCSLSHTAPRTNEITVYRVVAWRSEAVDVDAFAHSLVAVILYVTYSYPTVLTKGVEEATHKSRSHGPPEGQEDQCAGMRAWRQGRDAECHFRCRHSFSFQKSAAASVCPRRRQCPVAPCFHFRQTLGNVRTRPSQGATDSGASH